MRIEQAATYLIETRTVCGRMVSDWPDTADTLILVRPQDPTLEMSTTPAQPTLRFEAEEDGPLIAVIAAATVAVIVIVLLGAAVLNVVIDRAQPLPVKAPASFTQPQP
jgi:hypothetical protein